MSKPIIDTRWDSRRGELTYKVTVEGTSKILLFGESELRELRDYINTILKDTDIDSVTS